jgi:CofH subfamily radical SAM domain protein
VTDTAIHRALAGERLDRDALLDLYATPVEDVRAAAHTLRMRRTDPKLVTYAIYGNVDYTNVCVVGCDFCCYYRSRHDDDAFTLSIDEIAREAVAMREQGVDNVLLMGGVNPHLPFEWYPRMLRAIKAAHPTIWIDGFSPEEIVGFERLTGRDAASILAELKEAGMDSLPGVSAEILIDSVRHAVAPKRISSVDWFRIVDTAFAAGLELPCVSMVFGLGETPEQRVEHLLAVRDFQDHALREYGRGFQTFEVWPMRVQHTRAAELVPVRHPDEIAAEYLRHLSVGRLAIDNIDHHRAVWRTMGFEVAGKALLGGADELSGTGTINAITAVTELDGRDTPGPDEREGMLDDIHRCIADAGFTPARRDPHWQIMYTTDVQTGELACR